MIEVFKLSKTYGDYAAVREISFTAAKGEIVGFLGPNGAGKTTTMRMLSTFLTPTSGTAKVAGFDIQSEAALVRERIGYLPENPPLYDEMTVEEYLLFVGRIKGISANKLKASVGDVIDRCFLTNRAKQLCGQLSKGFRQRVGLAQAIIHDPEVVILDEPTSGLDPKQIIDIRNLIKDLGKEKTVLLSTHILPEVSMVCSKVVIVSRGSIAMEGALKDIVADKSLEQVFIECVSYDVNDRLQPKGSQNVVKGDTTESSKSTSANL
jgi:ABC-2 type transport system ATP-binding protein